MADISELLGENNPKSLQDLIKLRDTLRMSAPYEAAQKAGSSIPEIASPSADYGSLFGKQVAQDIVDTASIPGKTAAQSAEVFSKMAPEAISATAKSSRILPSLSSAGSSLLGKAALVAPLFMSEPGPSDSDEAAGIASGLKQQQAISSLSPEQKAGYAAMQGPVPPMFPPSNSSSQGISALPEEEEESLSQKVATSASHASPGSDPKGLLAKVAQLKAHPTLNPPPVRDTLSRLLGQSHDQMDAAKGQRNDLQLLANLGMAGSTIGQAITPLAPKQDYSKFWDTLKAQAEQPVADLATKQTLEQGALKGKILEGQAATEMSQSDPRSAVSDTLRQLIRKEAPGITVDDSMSYSDMAKLEPSLARMATQQASQLAHKDAQTVKQDAAKDKAYINFNKDIQSFRGNAGAQQASRDVLTAGKAVGLIDLPGMKTTQDLRVIADEIAKLATGGVPGEKGTEALLPHTALSKFAELKNFVLSQPTDAQADEYLKRNRAMLKNLVGESRNTLRKYSETLAKGYKHSLKPEDYEEGLQTIKQNYGAEPASETKSGPHGNTVVQGDHTYTWNPKSGKYE